MLKALIIEDETSLRDTLVEIFELEGFEVVAADNGESGIELIFENTPDVIICDINMRGMSGYDVLSFLRNVVPHEDIPPFIFLTAKIEQTDVRKGMNLGAEDYITKPFRNEDLIRTVRLQIEKRKELSLAFRKKEGKRISGILHDNLQQMLILAKLNIQNLRGIQGWDVQKLDEAARVINDAIQEARSIANNLENESDSDSLDQYLKTIQNSINRTQEFTFRFSNDFNGTMSDEVELAISKSVQELINNALKHSGGSELNLTIRPSGKSQVEVIFEDNGVGFSGNMNQLGYGLTQMNQRIRKMGGTLEIHAKNTNGMKASILLPLFKNPKTSPVKTRRRSLR